MGRRKNRTTAKPATPATRTVKVGTVVVDDGHAAVSAVLNPTRELPVVVVSRGNNDGRGVSDPVFAFTHARLPCDTYILDNHEAEATFRATFGEKVTPNRGAIRVFRPGAAPGDNMRIHPLILPVDAASPVWRTRLTGAIVDATPTGAATSTVTGSVRARQFTTDDGARLAAELTSPDRDHTWVVVSRNEHGDRATVCPDEVAAAVNAIDPDARVYSPAEPFAMLQFNMALPDHHRVHSGAVRVYPHTGDRRSTVILPWAVTGHVTDAVTAAVTAAKPANTTTTAPKPDPDMEDQVRELRARAHSAAADAAREKSRADRAEAALAAVRAELAGKDRYPVVYANADDQLAHELHLRWLEQVPEQDRADRPARKFVLAPTFAPSLDQHIVDRDKALTVCVEVLTRDVFTSNGRKAHPHRPTAGGGTGGITRDDGAVAWRANLKTNSPSAPRLLWWELADGTVELVAAVSHDAPFPT